MGAELGRISGPLLAKNLLRQGTDLAFETNLLYLDVTTGRVGINASTPDGNLSRLLTINGTTRISTNPYVTGDADLFVDTQAEIADIRFVSYKIQNDLGRIYVVPDQLSDPTITAPEVRTSQLKLVNRAITTLNTDTNIELTADGTGRVVFNTTRVNVNGTLHATGNITWDGNIVIGDSNTDNVVFESDINSNLIPNLDNTYDLGSLDQKWQKLYTETVNVDTTTLDALTVNGIDMLLTQGNVIYVSVNGSDTNYGDHLHSTFRTIKHALSVAQPGDDIVIFPGTYVEEFPLLVPQGVSVSGSGIRSVKVSPTAGTIDKDAFLLNGDTTVANLTVSGMKYDSVNDTGYGFRFAPGFKTVSRSPYVQTVSVINTAPNSGHGALVDGSVADPASNTATMLFHAVTFIVPGADGIIAKNGVRVEWLNSFTYFADHGIQLLQGTLGFASLGVTYGAEMRSINSANVYGNYGAVADGADTLGYLIGHNFGYIGSGTDSQNDDQLTLQANEIIAINGGQLYYDSMDHKGNYRIGDVFYVDQATGNVTFNAQSISFTAGGNITFDSPNGQTIVDATRVETGNIKIHDNEIQSLAGPVNFSAANGSTYLNTNVFVTGNINVTGDTYVDGNVYLGDTKYDLVTVFPKLTQNINPKLDRTYSLGTDDILDPRIWRTAFLTTLDIDGDTQFTNNTISTLTSGTDLRFVAAGTGKVKITSTDVQLDQSLTVDGTFTVNGTTTLQDTEIVGTTTLNGNIGQTGDTYITGIFGNADINITGTGSYFQVPNIKIQNNVISDILADNDLTVVANNNGGVIVDQKLKIKDNVITNVWSGATTNSQKSIKFTPNGTGNVVIDSTKYLKIPYSNDSTKVLSAPGEIRQNSTTQAYEGYLSTGTESFVNVYSTDKKTYITPELTIGANDNTLRFVVNNTVKSTITSTTMSNAVMQVGNFVLSGNTINNPVTNSDIVFQPTGTGSIDVNGLLFKDDSITNTASGAVTLQSTGTGYVKFTGSKAVIFPFGDNAGRRINPDRGETRYNTQLNYMEVYDGTQWIPAVGTLGAAPLSEVLDIMDLWGLILG